MIDRIKHVLSVLILICFFLPLCQCSVKQTPSPAGTPATQYEPLRHEADVESDSVFIAAKRIRFESASELLLICNFVWPLLCQLLFRRTQKRALLLGRHVVEIVLSVLSLWGFKQLFVFWPEWRYGGVLLCVSYPTFACLACIQLCRLWRAKEAV